MELAAWRRAQRRRQVARQPHGWLRPLVAQDAPFASSPNRTYSQSWAVTLYLLEKQSNPYGRYLKLTANRPAATEYPSRTRLADFAAVFGDDWTMFETRVARFADGLGK